MKRTYRTALTGLFFAVSVVLSLVEGAFPSLPVPGVKLGLSNIASMHALFFLGAGPALGIVCLKAAFAAFLHGPAAGFLSLCGGVLSMGVMILLSRIRRELPSVFLISSCGGVLHNL